MIKEALKLYDPRLHDINDTIIRRNKRVAVKEYTGKTDLEGRPEYTVRNELIKVSRISLDFVKYGIEQKAVFAIGAGVDLIPTDQLPVFEDIKRNWDDSKIENDLIELFRTYKAETQGAVLFYMAEDKERFKHMILSPSRGDKLEPIWDKYRDLVGFKRSYELEDDLVVDYYQKVGERVFMERIIGNTTTETIELPYSNLPIVYFAQEEGEFAKSKVLIDALERILSDADENGKYFANPMLMIKGENVALPEQQQAGKVLFGTGAETDAKFIMPENATEQNKFLWDTLLSQLFMQNRVAPLAFDTLKDINGLSGAAIEKMLTDCYIEASLNQKGEFGKGVQRMVNWLTREWVKIKNADPKFRVSVEFNDYTLQDEMELVMTRMQANGQQAVEDLETSLRKLGVKNIEERMAKLQSQPQEYREDLDNRFKQAE